MKKIWLIFPLLLTSCASKTHLSEPEAYTSSSCQLHYQKALGQTADQQLDTISDLYNSDCNQEVIRLGQFLRNQHRDKFYHVTAEAGEFFTPEGTFTEYVLESYERAYLSVLMSLSYLKLQKTEESLVELRQTSQDQTAQLYNYGNDLVLDLLLAAVWDHFDPQMARPYWKKSVKKRRAMLWSRLPKPGFKRSISIPMKRWIGKLLVLTIYQN
jgi:hypothetical protein